MIFPLKFQGKKQGVFILTHSLKSQPFPRCRNPPHSLCFQPDNSENLGFFFCWGKENPWEAAGGWEAD